MLKQQELVVQRVEKCYQLLKIAVHCMYDEYSTLWFVYFTHQLVIYVLDSVFTPCKRTKTKRSADMNDVLLH